MRTTILWVDTKRVYRYGLYSHQDTDSHDLLQISTLMALSSSNIILGSRETVSHCDYLHFRSSWEDCHLHTLMLPTVYVLALVELIRLTISRSPI